VFLSSIALLILSLCLIFSESDDMMIISASFGVGCVKRTYPLVGEVLFFYRNSLNPAVCHIYIILHFDVRFNDFRQKYNIFTLNGQTKSSSYDNGCSHRNIIVQPYNRFSITCEEDITHSTGKENTLDFFSSKMAYGLLADYHIIT